MTGTYKDITVRLILDKAFKWSDEVIFPFIKTFPIDSIRAIQLTKL